MKRRHPHTRGEVHVVRHADGRRWMVKRRGRAISRHRWQRTAVGAAIRTARRHRVDVLIHGRNGRIRSKDSYGNESPVRDTEH